MPQHSHFLFDVMSNIPYLGSQDHGGPEADSKENVRLKYSRVPASGAFRQKADDSFIVAADDISSP